MSQLVNAATSGWGLAAILFVGITAACVFALRGQARTFAASLSAVVAILLGGVAFIFVDQKVENVAPAQALAGLTNQREVPKTDRDVAAALMQTAAQAANMGDNDGARKAYDRAKQLYRAAKDILGEASVALGQAKLDHMNGQSAKARTNFNEALSLYQQGGSAVGQARTYAAWGDLEKDTFQWAKASEYYRLARAAWARAPEPKSDPHVMLGIEDVPLLREGEAKGRARIAQARKIFDQLDDKSGLAELKMIEAQLEMNLGKIDLARGQFAEARALFAGVDDAAMQGEAGLQVALIDISRGYNQQAALMLSDALAGLEEARIAPGAARVRIGLGDLERLQGRLDEASRYYGEAAAALGATQHRADAEAYRKLGEVQASLGKTEAARNALEKAAAAAKRSGLREEEALAHVAAAGVARKLNDNPGAQAHTTAAQALLDQSKNATVVARSALSLATEHNGFQNASAKLAAAGLPLGVVIAQLGLGDAYRSANNTADAQTAYRTAVLTWDAIDNKLVEANKLLGLPPVDSLFLVPDMSGVGDIYEAVDQRPEDFQPDPLLVKQNIDQFPHHNIEARTLVEQVEKRLAAVRELIRN